MEDFDLKLMEYPKWHDEEFTKDVLQYHLHECQELFEKGDEHLLAELIDLIQISKVFLRQMKNEKELEELYKKRFEKFMYKISMD